MCNLATQQHGEVGQEEELTEWLVDGDGEKEEKEVN